MINELRKMIAMLLVFCIVSSMCGTASAVSFNDVTSSGMDRAYFDAINYVSDRGIMNGISGGDFAPNVAADRAMIVVTLFRLSGDTGTYNQASRFTDVPSTEYYYNAVGWAVAKGITTGITSTEFRPEQIITWAEFFTFLHRYADYKGLPTNATEILTGAPDYGSLDSYAHEPVSWAYTYGMLLRSSPNAYIYPNANLERKTQALFLARFRRNVEGIVSNRDRFSFLNAHSDYLSSSDHIANSRYLISNVDWYRLTSLANGSQATLNALQDARRKEWNGSCLGMSLATILHAYGKINFSGTTANNCSTLYSIPKLCDYLSPEHRVTSDTCYYPPTYMSETESKINMYQMSRCIPSLATWSNYMAPYQQLSALLGGQEFSGLGLFCYTHEDSTKCGGAGGLSGHAVVTYGKPVRTSTGYKVMIYDNRCESEDSSNCWIEINPATWSGVVVTKQRDNQIYRETIVSCKYVNNFEQFNSNLDYDGPGNSYYLNNRTAPTEDSANELLAENKTQASDIVTVDGKAVSLVGKTILYVDCFQGFAVENGKGQKLQFVDGKASGTMKVYGMDFVPQGEDYPCTYAFIVDDSDSFICSNLNDSAKILSFSAYGENMSGNLMADSAESVGFCSISIDSTGRTVGEE